MLVVLQPGEPPPEGLVSLKVEAGALTGRQWVRVVKLVASESQCS